MDGQSDNRKRLAEPPRRGGRATRGCTGRSSKAWRWPASRSRCPGPRSSTSRRSSSSARAGSGPTSAARSTSTTHTIISSCPCRSRRSARRRRAPRSPCSSLAINVEPTMLGEMMLEMDEPPPPAGPTPRGISSTPMSEELAGAVIRLLECLKSPARQPHPRPPDGPRDRLSRAPRRAGRGPACPGQPGRPLRPHRPGPEARPRRVREAAQRRGAGEEGRDERRGLPPLLQARDGQLAAPVPQANPARPGEAAHGPRRATTRAPRRGRSGTRARRSSAGSSSGSSA